MNSSIKRRQTILVNWLAKTLNCQPITRAESGSYYTEFNTQYTGKSVIRISDHLSGERTYIHIILSPLNKTVIVNYKNFIWSGTFTNAKSIIYTLIMSKAMTEQCNPAPQGTTITKKSSKPNKDNPERYLPSWGEKLAKEMRAWIKKNPSYMPSFLSLIKSNASCKLDIKTKLWESYKNA